ncbi:hypothetical protein AB5N19_13681 [Seiridium cardinale]|uniref:Secreted protein n=1 Tax=Seiridium cardinale TaxID=138064 RepID=A0ABR2X646_9PEZI
MTPMTETTPAVPTVLPTAMLVLFNWLGMPPKVETEVESVTEVIVDETGRLAVVIVEGDIRGDTILEVEVGIAVVFEVDKVGITVRVLAAVVVESSSNSQSRLALQR